MGAAIDFRNESMRGDTLRRGRILWKPSGNFVRSAGMVDFKMDGSGVTAYPVMRILGGLAPNSFSNGFDEDNLQENRIKLEVKGSIDAVGNISTDSSIYADNYYGNVNQNLDISPGTFSNKVRITHGDAMYGNIIKYPIAEFDKDEIVFHKPVRMNSTVTGLGTESPFYFCNRTRINGTNPGNNVSTTFNLSDELRTEVVGALGTEPTTIIVEMYADVTSSPTGSLRTELYVSGDADYTKYSVALAKNIGGSRDDGANTGCANLQAFVPLNYDSVTDTYSIYYKWSGSSPSEYYIDIVGFSK